MLEHTLIIVGPGGAGKGPLAQLIRDDAATLDPYRLRRDGPRINLDDPLYAPPKLRDELCGILQGFGDSAQQIPCGTEKMEWFAKTKVLFFTVRGEWQFLILQDLEDQVAKAELYAPVLPALFSLPEICQLMGRTRVLILNPSPHGLLEMSDWEDLQSRTRDNIVRRGDLTRSVDRHVDTIAIEAPAWRTLIRENDALELTNWPFPEYRFAEENQEQLLLEARKTILRLDPELTVFFKNENEI